MQHNIVIVMIAIALACKPKLLIADEPTTALDVTVQAQILELIDGLRRETGMAVLLITHDLGVASGFCHRVVVLNQGHIVEEGPGDVMLKAPAAAITRELVEACPRLPQPD